jgi:hypothetical protein
MNILKIFFSLLLLQTLVFSQSIMPPSLDQSAAEPVKYIGNADTDKHFYDGRLRYVVGVHSRQVLRANRSNPPEGGLIGWTYNHAPMLCYWNGQFYLQYLSNLKEEHGAPGRTLILSSKDGVEWSNPRVLFPIYTLPKIDNEYGKIAEGTPAVAHQRMGFYVAPNGRLLTVSFISYCETPRHSPNKGQGLGRLVREIYKDGSFGPIYFIRYNEPAGWNESNTPHYSFYKTSDDEGFIEACNSLLADKLMTLQWWEMDRTKDGFYNIDPGDYELKALCFYHRPDNVVVALWKYNLSALSNDEGQSWTDIAEYKSLKTCAAKVWGQRMEDGKYSLVYNHSASLRNRFPLVIITGDDGHLFDNMLCLNGEVPTLRYQGIHKNIGLQYIRGIAEGNGNPPGDEEWITYSMNKEDIWISKIETPVKGTVDKHVNQDFDNLASIDELTNWNLYMPQWSPVTIGSDPAVKANKCLALTDEEPYDHAKAVRAFPVSEKVIVEFDLYAERVGPAALEIEVLDSAGNRPMRLRIDSEWLMLDRGPLEITPLKFEVAKWFHISMDLNCSTKSYNLLVDGSLKKENVPFMAVAESLERIEFRTGPWRGDVRPFIVDGVPGNPGLYVEDLPGADYKVGKSRYLIDNLVTR